MLTIIFAEKTAGDSRISLPLGNALMDAQRPRPIKENTGVRAVVKFLQNETRPELNHQLEGFHPPLVYVHDVVKQIPSYFLEPNSAEARVNTVHQQRYVNLHIPVDMSSLAMAVGDIDDARRSFTLLRDRLTTETYNAPYFEPIAFDIPKIKTELAGNQWFRRVRRDRDVSVIMYGERIEDDAIYGSLDADSTENDVGIIYSAPGAQLKIKLVTEGRIQFFNFRPEHMLTGHPKLGPIWPYVTDVIQFFTDYRQ